MVERVKRERPKAEEDERKTLVQKFTATLREDPWFNEIPHAVVGHSVSDFYNKVCWLLYGEHKPKLEMKDGRWVCTGESKFGAGEEPREALIRWYISMRAGKPTVSDLREEERQAEQESRRRRSRGTPGEVDSGGEEGERRHRRVRSSSDSETSGEGDSE